MEVGAWLGWQIDYLLVLQNFRDISHHVFDSFFVHITMFGEVIIPVFFMTFIYWCVNKKAGQFLLWNYTLGCMVNIFLKITACIYRPWILSQQIHPVPQAIPAATGYSFPSGHTTSGVATWGGAAFWWRKNKFILPIATVLILLIMFSRNYLGVHTPQDVVVSFFVGIGLLFLIKKIMDYSDNNKNGDLVITVTVTVAITLLLVYMFLKSYPCDYLNGKLLYDTYGMKLGNTQKALCTLGLFWGWLIEKRFIGYLAESGSILNKLSRYVGGVIGLILLIHIKNYVGICGNLFVNNAILYFVIGLFITFIHPFIFSRFETK